MKNNNIYDDEEFFEAYNEMPRSKEGLTSAGEWHQLKQLFPDLHGRTVLDLGCGLGWHCRYAREQGAVSIVGIDSSERMLEQAKNRYPSDGILYRVCDLEDYEYPPEVYDLVISNLVLHYIKDLENIYHKVYQTLKPGGIFIFNIEHPAFTAGVNQQWITDGVQNKYWPIDNYYYPGERKTDFIGHTVIKQHHTLTQILMGLLQCGFYIEVVEEVMPAEDWLHIPGMLDEMRRPMMLMVKVRKCK